MLFLPALSILHYIFISNCFDESFQFLKTCLYILQFLFAQPPQLYGKLVYLIFEVAHRLKEG